LKSLSLLLCYSLFLLVITPLAAQKTIFKGHVTDSLQQPVSRVSVIASYDKETTTILAYTTTDTNGNFTLSIKQDAKHNDIWVSYRHVSYAFLKNKYPNNSQTVNITLKEQSNVLDEIILNAKKTVEVKGDTITYNVNGLKKEKDYTIEEVITRIPGVKVAENGQISYNNKTISHLYVNGVDLLEGRYNIATRGIPADAVESIDILKKHNHARIDIGRTNSDKVAFNLKIKKNHNLIFGSAKLNAGLPLLTANADITPIYFKDNFQDIASVKANNIGTSLQSHGANLTKTNRDFSVLENEIPNILSIPNTTGYNISDKYWLDNNSISVTNDALIKSGEHLILKAGGNYNYTKNKLQHISNQVYYFGEDSTVVNRNTKNKLTSKNYHIGLVEEINKEHLYLKNKTIINGDNTYGFSNIIQNENPLNYYYQDDILNIKNTTEFKTATKNKIINSGLLLDYTSREENNKVNPSVFNTEIPSNINALLTKQVVNTNHFSLGGYADYNFKIGEYQSQIKQRLSWKTIALESNLKQTENVPTSNLAFPYISDFKLNTFESSTRFKMSIDVSKFTFTIDPELKHTYLNKQEYLSPQLNEQESYTFFQPSALIKYKIDHQWHMTLSGNYMSSISDYSNLFNAVILRNYNSLYRNSEKTNITHTTLGAFYFSYSNILSGFLFSNSTNLSQSKSNFTWSSNIDSNGLIKMEAISAPNSLNNFSNTTNFTKKIFKIIKTDVSYTFNQIKSNQIFNTVAQNTKLTNHTIDIGLNIDNNTWYAFKYKGTANFGKTSSSGFKNSNTFFKQNVEIDFYTSLKTRLNLNSESTLTKFSGSNTTNKNTLYNAQFYYKPSKKLFLSASFNNIFNEKFFTTIQNNENFISQSQFSLRPRQFTLGINFSF